MSSRSFPSSSCSRRTPTLSRRHHPSSEKPPYRREPQPPSAESFAALGEHPRDPHSVLPFSLSHLVHRSTLAAMLRRAARSAMAPSGFPCRATVGRAGADLHRPFVDQRLRLEPKDTLHVLNRGQRSENRRLSFNKSLWTHAPAAVDPFHGIFSKKIIW
jgi:hypothetical protein